MILPLQRVFLLPGFSVSRIGRSSGVDQMVLSKRRKWSARSLGIGAVVASSDMYESDTK